MEENIDNPSADLQAVAMDQADEHLATEILQGVQTDQQREEEMVLQEAVPPPVVE